MDNIFGNEQCNALFEAMMRCAEDDDVKLYDWLEGQPKISMTQLIVDKLNEMGYKIERK